MFSAKAGVILTVLAHMLKMIATQQPQYCSEPSITGPCKAYFPRYFYNTGTGMCQQFVYGGCQGNDNNFGSLVLCTSACVCSLPSSPGQSFGRGRCWNSRRFFHDAASGSCNAFRYNGCGGNRNNFRWKGFCNYACSKSSCFLPSKTGPCKAAFKRFYYNHVKGTCEEFIYGGCKGNGNNFKTFQECQSTCNVVST